MFGSIGIGLDHAAGWVLFLKTWGGPKGGKSSSFFGFLWVSLKNTSQQLDPPLRPPWAG